MLQPINDINLEDELWLDHNPLDGSAIGGAMPKEYILVQDIPGQPHAVMLALNGPAWATMEAYCPRPNFVNRGPGFVVNAFTLTLDDKAAYHVLEFDLIRTVRMPDGAVWHFDGSFQINIAEGWMLQVDTAPPAPPKVPTWQDTGIKIPPLAPNMPHTIAVTHHSDMAAKTHSVLSVAIDGTQYVIPAAFQNLPATPSTWAPDLDLEQVQITAESNGGACEVILTAVSKQHRMQA